jgi:hypothetical protein
LLGDGCSNLRGRVVPNLPPRPDQLERRWLRLPAADEAKPYFDILQPTLLILGLMLYGAGRISTETFYAELGTTPEEVGLGYLTAVTRAAIGVVAAGTLIYLYVVILTATTTTSRRTSGDSVIRLPRPPPTIRRQWISFGLVVLFALIAFVSGALLEMPAYMAFAALVPVGLALLLWINQRKNPLTPYFVAVAVGLSLVGIAVSAYMTGKWEATRVTEGLEVHAGTIFGVVPLKADCVSVVWLGLGNPPPALSATNELMYLGRADSSLVLFRPNLPNDYGLLRVSTSDVALSDRSCERDQGV